MSLRTEVEVSSTLKMNQKERDRLAVFRRVEEGPPTLKEAADRLGLGDRQTRRQYRRYR